MPNTMVPRTPEALLTGGLKQRRKVVFNSKTRKKCVVTSAMLCSKGWRINTRDAGKSPCYGSLGW